MRITSVFSAILLLTSIGVYGQAPTLTATNTFPLPGTTTAVYSTTSFNPGGDGAGQTWDYSNTAYQLEGPHGFYDCSYSNAQCLRFPGTNLVESNGLNPATHEQYYYNATATGIQIISSRRVSVNEIKYDTPFDWLRFPFTYGQTYTQSAHYLGSSGTGYIKGIRWCV